VKHGDLGNINCSYARLPDLPPTFKKLSPPVTVVDLIWTFAAWRADREKIGERSYEKSKKQNRDREGREMS
jgi:hypothetical protein